MVVKFNVILVKFLGTHLGFGLLEGIRVDARD